MMPLVSPLAMVNDLWYALPLIVTVSLVYSATRHERMGPILFAALRFSGWVLGFMVVSFAVLFWLTKPL